jgi:hypothetical protein
MQPLLEAAASSSAQYQDVANLAQIILAGAAVLALLGAAVQIRVTRTIAKRQLAYEYLRRFSGQEMLELTNKLREFWKETRPAATDPRRRWARCWAPRGGRGHGLVAPGASRWGAFEGLEPRERAQILVVPNLIEEIGALYNRRRLDRDVVALALGVMVELLWVECQALVKGGQADRGEWVYSEWAEMQADTRERRERAHNKIRRRRTWKNLMSGRGR